MKERSVTQRNLVGAFLGGFAGILATGYIHPALLPGGCLLGVIIGWWYQEIYCTVADTVQSTIQWTEDTANRIISFVLTPARELKKMKVGFGGSIKVFHFCLYWSFWRWSG